MIDILTYIPDLTAFRLEAKQNADNNTLGFSIDEDGNISYNISKIPVHYNADELRSVCLIRLVTQDEIDVFDSLQSCERIGVCENNSYIFDDGGEAIYNDVYDQTPVIIDEDTAYTPPSMIGATPISALGGMALSHRPSTNSAPFMVIISLTGNVFLPI